jgi:uncharacterized RDD family membrane protein YckC
MRRPLIALYAARGENEMDWYYKNGDIRTGPVTDEQMRELALQGTITPNTLVWNELVAKWQPYSEQAGGPASPSAPVHPHEPKEEMQHDAPKDHSPDLDSERTDHQTDYLDAEYTPPRITEAYCSQCFNKFPIEELIQYGDAKICGVCKPLFFQKVKEGVKMPGTLRYAGFWIRFVAKSIDNIIVGVIGMLFYAAAFSILFLDYQMLMSPLRIVVMMLVYVLQISFGIAYATFFVGKYGATPGKMALNLAVVNPDGTKVSYMKAFGRFFAEIISGIILLIGYIMAAFDSEKQALHDRICSTRVIRKSA